jgi:hypothetical protein
VTENENLDKLEDSPDVPSEPTLPLARAEWRTVPIMVALMSFATLVLAMIVISYTAWESHAARIRVQQAAECLIEQFAEHREVNRAAHQAFSKKLDAPYQGNGQLPDVLPDLEEACKSFERR